MNELRHRVDEKSKEFLRAVQEHGGRATTTEIRQRTGLNQNETNYRFRKLEELDLIEIGYADTAHQLRDPPKVAHLTGKARKEIERGLLRVEDDDGDGAVNSGDDDEEVGGAVQEELREVRENMCRLEERVNVMSRMSDDGTGSSGGDELARLAEQVERLSERVSDIEERGAGGSGGGADADGQSVAADEMVQSEAFQGLERRIADLEKDVDWLDEYVREWTETAETYLLATRRILDDRLDISMRSHLDAVAKENSGSADDGDGVA